MLRLVEQATTLIDDVYVHLPLKRAMHAVDPVQSLKLLRRRLAAISERQFHNEMIDIFNSDVPLRVPRAATQSVICSNPDHRPRVSR